LDLPRLAAALRVFGDLDPGLLPFHHVQALVFIAQHGSVTFRQMEEEFNLTNASISRSVSALGGKKNGRPGLGLVEVYVDPDEGRRYRVRLTSRGKAKIKTVCDVLAQ
jgi:DNA-binding MarR family transcriptional regulator